MSYLVDTNVFSELAKPEPDANVVAWLRKNEPHLHISAISIGELRRGIERLPAGERRTKLHAWLQVLCARMKGRVLIFNTGTAHVWGQLKAKRDADGIAVPSLHSQLAATARRYDLILVTRNTRDFVKTEVRLLNPFEPTRD